MSSEVEQKLAELEEAVGDEFDEFDDFDQKIEEILRELVREELQRMHRTDVKPEFAG